MSNRRSPSPRPSRSGSEPSIARRSERIRRRRGGQQNPGLDSPGTYSLFKNGFVVASESTLHPSSSSNLSDSPAIAEDDSRRARYRKNSTRRSTLPTIPEASTIPGHTKDSELFVPGEDESARGITSRGFGSITRLAQRLTCILSPRSSNGSNSGDTVADENEEIVRDAEHQTPEAVSSQPCGQADDPYKDVRSGLLLLVLTVFAITFYAFFFPTVREQAILTARGSPFVQSGPNGGFIAFKELIKSIPSVVNPVGVVRRFLAVIREEGLPPEAVTSEQLEAFGKRVIREARQAAADEAAVITKNLVLGSVSAGAGGSSPRDIEAASRRAIELYAADKGAEPDYALLSAGARVIESKPSLGILYGHFLVNYVTSLLKRASFIPTVPKGPSVAFTPGIIPGECWAFPGGTGSVTVRLARPIIPRGFTMEHTPASSAFSVTSAPRKFRVHGLRVNSRKEVYLGEWEYDTGGGFSHMQSWKVKDSDTPVRAIRLEVLSNHGAELTCLYRFRVHGEEVNL